MAPTFAPADRGARDAWKSVSRRSGDRSPVPGRAATDVAQTTEPTVQTEATTFNAESLDALLAPVALYPDALLVQVLMASTFPLQVVEASRWLEEPGNKDLQGDALAQALENLNWDPSVKSLVPFPQVLATLNSQLEWMQQLGYAFATQQADVMASVQRLRHQAQASGTLATTEQQRVAEENGTIAIEPASPQTVYVPVYNPTVVYGAWPNPAYQPVYIPPPADYGLDSAVVGGLGLCDRCGDRRLAVGWARPRWHHGHVHVDVDRFNRIEREPGRDPVRGLATAALCRGGPALSSAGGAGRTASASGAPAGGHLRLAECPDAWGSGAPLDGARVPAAARSVDPADAAGRAPAGRYPTARRPQRGGFQQRFG